jgi:uncharacterized membrane protein
MPGLYVANGAIAKAQRFQPKNFGANAVFVTTRVSAPVFFGRIFNALNFSSADAATSAGLPSAGSASSEVTIGAQAIAMQQSEASFAIGSSLATVNGGILNSLFAGLLGSNISLSAMSYQSLISAKIDMFSFSNMLAARANLAGITYNSLANSNVTASQAFGAILDAAQASSNANADEIAALAKIAALESSASNTMQVSSLIDYGPFGLKTVGSQPPIGASVSAFDLISVVAQVANGSHEIQAALNVNLPGVINANMLLAIGERPVGTSWVSVGSSGASVHTAQTRLLLTVQLLGAGATKAITLPIYIEIASGTAVLGAMQCASPSSTSVTLNVTPGLVDAWIGNVSPTQLNNFSTAPSVGPATLVSLPPVATVTGVAHAAISNVQSTPVTFVYSDISGGTKKTVSTTDYVATLISSLVGNLRMQVDTIGVGIGVPANLSQTIANTAAAELSPLDEILSNIFGTLGVGLGNADTWVMGVNCTHAVLVN